MADAVLSFMLENLKQLLLYKADLILNVKDDVESLHGDLRSFKAFLEDSSEDHNNTKTMKDLVQQIRELVYKAEDAVDTYVWHTGVHSGRSSLAKARHLLDHTTELHNVALEIRNIKATVKDKHGNSSLSLVARQYQYGQGYDRSKIENKVPNVEEDNVVGFQDEKEQIIKLLIEGSEELEVISITGMPGLGKTTLSKMVFRDHRIESKFSKRAWVYVSQNYNRKEVFLNIFRHLITKIDADMHTMPDEFLAQELQKVLEKGKYLIVIDDVWENEDWNDLKRAFPNNKNHSRILLTSRKWNVARLAIPYRKPLCLRFLTNEESWELLQLKALGSKEHPYEDLIIHGKHIAEECNGLPLALVVIGGILLQKGTEENQWKKVATSVNAYLSMDPEKRMEKIVTMSFNDLPYHLKACFLYFGMFPGKFSIPVSKLFHLWIAEGLIEQKVEMSLEDIAEEYLEDLVNRNLVSVGVRRLNGKVKIVHIHDNLREFCKKKAEEEFCFHEIKEFNQGSNSSVTPTFENSRRLGIHSHVSRFISSKPCGEHIRSFLCFSSEEIPLSSELTSFIPKAFKLLRVLDSRPINFGEFPNDLSQLIHLRYLDISSDSDALPAGISALWNMETLIITTSSPTFFIKTDIWKMIKLRHLKINASTSLQGPLAKTRKKARYWIQPSSLLAKTKKSKENTQISGNLQLLSAISPESCTTDVLGSAPNLKKLGIRGRIAKLVEDKGGSSLFDGLGNLDNLETLKLLNDVKALSPSEGKLASLPNAYKFPPNLKKLTLSETLLDWEHMSTLGQLQKLEILKLKDNAFRGIIWQPEHGGFQELRVLYIGRTDLVSWTASAHHFPKLRSLFIRNCENLHELPSSLADISTIETIDLFCTTRSAVDSARKIEHIKNNQPSTRYRGFKLHIYLPDQNQ